MAAWYVCLRDRGLGRLRWVDDNPMKLRTFLFERLLGAPNLILASSCCRGNHFPKWNGLFIPEISGYKAHLQIAAITSRTSSGELSKTEPPRTIEDYAVIYITSSSCFSNTKRCALSHQPSPRHIPAPMIKTQPCSYSLVSV